MSNFNLTNPSNPPKSVPKRTAWDYRDGVVAALVQFGIPLQAAEIAVIDMKTPIYQGYHNRLTSTQTACTIVDDVRKIYLPR